MTALTAQVEDGEWGDKPFLVTLGGSRVIDVDTRQEAYEIAGRLNRIIASRVEAALEAVFAEHPDRLPFSVAVEEALLGTEAPEPDTRTDAEKRQDVYVLLGPRERAVLLYCAAGRLAHRDLRGSEVIPRLKTMGLYKTGGVALGDELTPWGLEIAAGVARALPGVWRHIQEGTFVPKAKYTAR